MSTRGVILAVFVVALTVLAFGSGVGGSAPLSSSVGSPGHAAAVAAPAAPTPSSVAPTGPYAAMVDHLISQAKAQHLPMETLSLPALLGTAHSTLTNGVVSPGYSVAPAPMGIGAYGVMNSTGTASAYSIETTSWEGAITLNSANTFLATNDGAISTNGSQNTFGVQLNAVTINSTVGGASNYSFWTQNVLYFNFPSPGYITFLDNVWNFSSPAVALAAGTLYSYNGTPVYPEFYYDFGPSLPYTFPLTVQLYLNTSITNLASTGFGYTTVRFGYNVIEGATGQSEASGVYDTVLFNSTTPIGKVPASPYLVSGSQITQTGFIPYDAEIMIGGPGGGTTTSVYGISGMESLMYWDSATHQYVFPPSAWNVGSETGETSQGISETYTSPGMVDLHTGPSFVMPFWNSTPGGNLGQATVSGTLSPSNSFIFFTNGSKENVNYASWAPTQTSTTFDYVVPPGSYQVAAMLSDHTPINTSIALVNGGTQSETFDLATNMSRGVYTPLFAWNNAQLAAISSGGNGTLTNPYLIVNNAPPDGHGIASEFGELNDYLYPVFPGVFLADTSAYVSLDHPSLLNVTYQSGYDAALEHFGLPYTNNLQFQFYDASNVTLWGANGISGWFFYADYGPLGFLPLANVVVWGGYHDLIGDNTFVSQGSSLLLAGINAAAPTDNVVWGNTFVNATNVSLSMWTAASDYGIPVPLPVGIFEFEAGDLLYNNFVDTTITAFGLNYNIFFGTPQLNLDQWNLPQPISSSEVTMFNGYALSGSIVGVSWQAGNFWYDAIPGTYVLPYNDFGFIMSGGDYLPYPALSILFVATGSGIGALWSVTIHSAALNESASLTTRGLLAAVYVVPGTYTFTASAMGGISIAPASGTIVITNTYSTVVLTLS